MLGINLNNLKLNLLSFRSLVSRFSVRIFKFPRRNFSPACCAHVESVPPPSLAVAFHEWILAPFLCRMRRCAAGGSWTEIEIETEHDWKRRAASTESLSEKQRAVNASQQLRSGARRVRLSLRSQLGEVLPASLWNRLRSRSAAKKNRRTNLNLNFNSKKKQKIRTYPISGRQ